MYYLTKDELCHHGKKGQKWGVRNFQNADGTWTEEGKARRRSEFIKYANDKNKSKNYNKMLQIADDLNAEANNRQLKIATKNYQVAEDKYIHDQVRLKEKYGDNWFKKASDKELGKVYRNITKYEDEKRKARIISDDIVRNFFKENIQTQESLWKRGNPHATNWYRKQEMLDKSIKQLSDMLVDVALSSYYDDIVIRDENGDDSGKRRPTNY